MSWSSYLSFLVFAVVLVLIPGVDFTVIVRNTLTGGSLRGRWSAVGVASANIVQGSVAVAGLGAVIVHSQPLFLAIRWAGIAYLVLLAGQAFRSAWRGRYDPVAAHRPGDGAAARAQRQAGWRQGFLSTVTNPKVLVFYLAVLPQFVGPATPVAVVIAFAVSHAVLSLAYLLLVVAGLDRARRVLRRRAVRRLLDTATGVVLVGFGARLVADGP
ncbi:LysE family translocator [Micromonospora sp. CPCC 206060]|uniref:LysE family translocator n=1 Tax=Micromonospora sp. CPCC 206060 TaxID=3122406 RepID=UPI002FF13EDB